MMTNHASAQHVKIVCCVMMSGDTGSANALAAVEAARSRQPPRPARRVVMGKLQSPLLHCTMRDYAHIEQAAPEQLATAEHAGAQDITASHGFAWMGLTWASFMRWSTSFSKVTSLTPPPDAPAPACNRHAVSSRIRSQTCSKERAEMGMRRRCTCRVYASEPVEEGSDLVGKRLSDDERHLLMHNTGAVATL